MITLEVVQRIWDLLQRPTSSRAQVEARELDSIHTKYGSPLVTIDVYGHRHLLLPASTENDIEEDTHSSGIHIVSNQWVDADQSNSYIDVSCLKPHLNDLFDMVLLDILQMYPDHPDHPDKVCITVLDRWRELLSGEKRKLPDRSVLIGVWGELQLLLKFTAHTKKAVNAWRGPFGGRRDFYTGTTAVEIKTSTQRRSQTVIIHGHDQLEIAESENLYLSLVRVEEAPSTGENISDLINKLLGLGCSRIKLLKALNNIGLSADLISESDDLRLRLIDWRMYHVDEQFPRITATSFADGHVPDKVSDIIYKIDLSAVPPNPLSADLMELVLKQFAAEVK